MVGGGTIQTSCHQYHLYLGPTADEKYHENTAQGLDQITSKLQKFNLQGIHKEYYQNATEDEKKEILPEYVGGDQVHLLVGIKHSTL